MIIGAIFLLVSILVNVTLSTINMYKEDKMLDIEALKKSGLTIVVCSQCKKENVLEDQYCIYCGEELKESVE